mmetsp:Transcript_18539/g.21334  ORF Transcript_18539/g.21334 Transcript_18539/m.21334 type:complete len:230 (-) Transcript_18539:413-1102(-)
MHWRKKTLKILTLFTIACFVQAEDEECPWNIEGEVVCGENNFIGSRGTCQYDVGSSFRRTCYEQAKVLCFPYKKSRGEDCLNDCARYHQKCCCYNILATPTVRPSPRPTTLEPSGLDTTVPSAYPNSPPPQPTTEPPASAPVKKTLRPTVDCPWKDYISNCRLYDIRLGEGDCAFNPGNHDGMCALNTIGKCQRWVLKGALCAAKCKDFHRECCCGVTLPDADGNYNGR